MGFSRIVDSVSSRIGKAVAWLVLATVLISAGNAVVRKTFSTSSNAWLEIQWVLFGAVFLLAAAWTLRSDKHIRIDIVYGALPKRWRNRIDLFGHLVFLLPATLVLLYLSVPFFWRPFILNEQSMNAGGLPVYPSKLLVLLAFALLFVQGCSEVIKRIAVLRGHLANDVDTAEESSLKQGGKNAGDTVSEHPGGDASPAQRT